MSIVTESQGEYFDYALHTIGWAAFQDLCMVIAKEEFQRPIEEYRKTKDKGRDGSFKGIAEIPLAENNTQNTAIQCKHFSSSQASFRLSDLAEERPKIKALVKQGLAHGYIIMTNASVAADDARAIEDALKSDGVTFPNIFGKQWIGNRIHQSPRIRALAPRLYGLGDLSLILDERAIAQAKAVLSSLGDDMKCYVPTKAHSKAVRALLDHGFVILLGAPAAGKSIIAANLALASLDQSKTEVIRVTQPQDFEKRWNPDHVDRLFWVDDAFGSTQLQRGTLDLWNKLLPTMEAARRAGNRFVLTSRDYIWTQAKKELKVSTFKPLSSGQVVVDVEDLKAGEKKRILYNHVRLGGQAKEFREWIKPLLEDISSRKGFQPETARRIGSPEMTKHLPRLSQTYLKIVDYPQAFLEELIDQLDAPSRAAIALVFIYGGRLPTVIPNNESFKLVSDLLGVNKAEVIDSLDALAGSLLLKLNDLENGESYWTYKHPTIADAYSSLLTKNPALIQLYLHGAKAEAIMNEVVCGKIDIKGALLVPVSEYDLLANRLTKVRNGYSKSLFLTYRTDSNFLKIYAAKDPTVIVPSFAVSTPSSNDLDLKLFIRFNELGLASPQYKSITAATLIDHISREGDLTFLDLPEVMNIFNDQEKEALENALMNDYAGNLELIIDSRGESFDMEGDPSDHFDYIKKSLKKAKEFFLERKTELISAIAEAEDQVSNWVGDLKSKQLEMEDRYYDNDISSPTALDSVAEVSIFDDIDKD